MKYGSVCKLALIGLGLATFAVTPAHAQTTAPGPYYAVPSWDQTLPAATRFIVLSNMGGNAVLDRETGLVWEKAPSSGTSTWEFALSGCQGLILGNRVGWRLPALEELQSLVDPSVNPGPTLPSGHPFVGISGALPTYYWTATSIPYDPTIPGIIPLACALDFSFPSFPLSAFRAVPGRRWCVRGGQGVPPLGP